LEKSVQTLERALDIIELLAVEKEGLGVTEIGNRVGLHKSTVHRLLNSLAERGYIEKEPRYGIYKLGLKIIEISSLYLNKLELKTEALPYLRKLAETVGQPVHLAILRGKEAVYIEKVEVVSSIRMYSQIGRRVPVYCSAIGKVLLSGLEGSELDMMLKDVEFKSFTPNTLRCSEDLMKEITGAREKGWAMDDEEHEAGIRCIAAPVHDYTGRVIAAVSTSGDMKIIQREKDEETSRYVRETAMSISKRMGYIL
jgi:IclR family transcriptional regulator, KDG regulon repressor